LTLSVAIRKIQFDLKLQKQLAILHVLFAFEAMRPGEKLLFGEESP